MASAVIHICVANEINKVLKKDKKQFLIGSIAPDISKQLGMAKKESHFLDKGVNTPNLKIFLLKYFNDFDDDFVLGYYVHLYTDYLWFKYFVPEFIAKGGIYKLDGTRVEVVNMAEDYRKYIYNDYTNLNIKLIEEYDLDLKIFYEELPEFQDIIKEIPMKRIGVIVEQVGIIIENSTQDKTSVFDMSLINKFVEMAVQVILDDLKELMVI